MEPFAFKILTLAGRVMNGNEVEDTIFIYESNPIERSLNSFARSVYSEVNERAIRGVRVPQNCHY